MILRPYQVESIDDLRASFRQGHTKIVLAAPTGSGKSVMMLEIISGAEKKGSRSLFICERRILVEQFSRHLDSIGVDHGVLMANHWRFRPHAKVQVASAQTLERMETWPAFDLVFIDELHACMRKSVVTMLKTRPDLKVIGATATPFHPEIAEHFTSVTSVISMSQLVENGSLVPFRVFVAKEIDTSGVPVVAGEWKKDELETRGRQIVGDIVTDYIRISQDVFGGYRKTICFSCGVAHGADLVRRFGEAGINAVQLTYKDDEDYKAQVLQDFAKPDTDIQMLVSADILTRGYDQTDVEHVILARPLKKSFSSHVQMVGRGARPHPGKEFCVIQDNCVAEGSKILTNRGLVPVELILLSDRIWDGHDFVQHKGAISRGRKPVITYAGLTATRDHLVKTAEAWRTFGECAEEQASIVTTGIGGEKVFERSNYFTSSHSAWAKREHEASRFSRVRNVWQSCNRLLLKPLWRHIKRLQEVQPNRQENSSLPKLAFCSGIFNEGSVRERKSLKLRELRRERDSIRVRLSKGRGNLDTREHWNPRELQGYGVGQDKQQRELQAWESAMGNSHEEYGEPTKLVAYSEHAQVHAGKSRRKVRGYYAQIIAFCRNVFRGNIGSVQQAESQTEREVWDILDCGPRNSFTCEGLLVHNCGNWLRFADSWGDLYEQGVQSLESDADKKARKEPSDKEKEAAKCPRCGALWPGHSDTCSHCGHVRARASAVVEVAGEMMELGRQKAEKYSAAYKRDFYAQLLGYAEARGQNPGSAYHRYVDKFGVGPSMAKPEPQTPGLEVIQWVRSRNIAFAKSRAKDELQQVAA